ncbi:Pkinase-domain-containing protein [Artomyces pyxidatus]|uniref:Pkinase-domain-containing protein n=1 Tax=Artomyces pyxidatus TaxID=48021 RepID=A0ACB8SPF9_9AGAM|nr:Pkinase-domain-containing protein [Artomyces pyxidatus]
MGIMHRDLKPENILLSPAGDARIGDLGAAFTHAHAQLVRGEPYSRDLNFTPGYAAPELVGADIPADERWTPPDVREAVQAYGPEIDWWGLGCVFFALVAGDILFRTKRELAQYAQWYAKRGGRAWLHRHLEHVDAGKAAEDLLYGVRALFFDGL